MTMDEKSEGLRLRIEALRRQVMNPFPLGPNIRAEIVDLVDAMWEALADKGDISAGDGIGAVSNEGGTRHEADRFSVRKFSELCPPRRN